MTAARNLAAFVAGVTRTVVSFEPTGERFQNTVTGRVMDAGILSFDCGHTYTWRPFGMADTEPMPAPGARLMCATCIADALGCPEVSA